jgi:hypothetical protein
MGGIPSILLQHQIVIEPYQGTTGHGDETYGPPVAVVCFLDQKVRMVRSPSTGDEVVSSSTAYAHLDTTAPAMSRVTLPDGRVTTVHQALRRDGGSLPLPSHLEIVLE